MSHSEPMSQSVLVVDDEKNVRRILRQALEDLGLSVETAADGSEALGRIEEADYDLMLMDPLLPVMDGLEVLQRVHHTAPDLPIVIITAQGTIENTVQAMRSGAVDVLLKPISLDSLRSLVDRVLQRPVVEGAATPYDEWIRLATWHVRHQRTEAAQDCLEKAVNQDGQRPEAHTLFGILEGTDGNIAAARDHLEAAVEQDPEAATAQLLLDCLQENAAFPVDRAAGLTHVVTSEADATAEKQSVFPEPSSTEEEVPHRVLAVLDERIADGATAADRVLTQFAASSARGNANGELLLLSVVEVPWQLTLSQAEEAMHDRIQEVHWQLEALADEMTGDTLRVRPMVVVAHQTASILENVVAQQPVQHLVGTWPGGNGDDSSGWIDVVDDISCEVTLLRVPVDASVSDGTGVTAFVSDSLYAPFVARRALEWAQGSGVASLTLLTIQADDGSSSKEDLRHRGQRLLWDVADQAGLEEEQYDSRVLISTDVKTAAERCAGACDRICVGASRSSSWAESVFGSFPERLASASDGPVALVRGPYPGSRSFLEDLGRRLAGA